MIENHIPRLRELCQNGDLHIDNIDVFCEKGICSVSTPDVLHGVYSCQITETLCITGSIIVSGRNLAVKYWINRNFVCIEHVRKTSVLPSERFL